MLMTMTQKSQKLTYPFTKENRKLVKDMLLLLQHPFILPIADLDFMVDQSTVVVVYPLGVRGSLKDYIFQVSADKLKEKKALLLIICLGQQLTSVL